MLDNGEGISHEARKGIFDLFVQGEKTLERSDSGLGVGLTLVRMLVELHGGSITVHSDGLGKGSEFVVRLPLTKKRPMPPKEAQTESVPLGKVLIIEDNADSREMLKALLVMEGYDVATAADGHSGLAAIETIRPAVALVDIGLPGIDGYEIARHARSKLKDVPRLVALTGYGRAEDRQAVLDAGFDEHLVKPVKPNDLTRVLRKPA